MQTHGADVVELTLLWDRDDYKRFFWITFDRDAIRIQSYTAAGLLAVATWCLTRDDYSAAAIAAYFALYTVGMPLFVRMNRMRKLPDHFFAPYTYRLDQEGFHCSQPFVRISVPWNGITSAKAQKGFWRIDAIGGSWLLPLRTLTDADRTALQTVSSRFGASAG